MKLVAEAGRSALAQPVASAVIALLVAGACAAILATTGQTVKAEQDVLARIDDAGTRSVVITDLNGTAELTTEAVDRLTRLEGVSWAIALGRAQDVRPVGNPAGNPAAMRDLYGELPSQIGVKKREYPIGNALVGEGAQRTLGLVAPLGGVQGESDVTVVGGFEAREPLAFLNRGLIRPTANLAEIRTIHILVDDPSMVEAVASAAITISAPADLTSIGLETSETLADVRAAVEGELGRFGRSIALLVLAAGALLISLAVYAGVTTRRRDFGRRRALGASRGDILTLVCAQTGVAALIGALTGIGLTWPVLVATTGVTPDVKFATATGILTVSAGLIASLPPAIGAALRDPVAVLRVP